MSGDSELLPAPETPRRTLGPGACGELACVLEATAPKAGNVHPLASFADLEYADFLAAAAAIAPALELAPGRGIGATVLDAVERTRAAAATNVNLGIVLLLAPLAKVHAASDLRAALRAETEAATVGDADAVYRAIRAARPGGLGKVEAEDVGGAPARPLLEVMRLAATRDLIARQYATGYEDVFEIGLPELRACLAAGLGILDAIVRCHLRLVAALGDSLIRRKVGAAIEDEARERAAAVLAADWPRGAEARRRFEDFDRWLRADGHRRNPGATADLVCGVVYVGLRDGWR